MQSWGEWCCWQDHMSPPASWSAWTSLQQRGRITHPMHQKASNTRTETASSANPAGDWRIDIFNAYHWSDMQSQWLVAFFWDWRFDDFWTKLQPNQSLLPLQGLAGCLDDLGFLGSTIVRTVQTPTVKRHTHTHTKCSRAFSQQCSVNIHNRTIYTTIKNAS